MFLRLKENGKTILINVNTITTIEKDKHGITIIYTNGKMNYFTEITLKEVEKQIHQILK